MTRENPQEIPDFYEIRSPHSLFRLVGILKGLLSGGVLCETGGTCSLADIREDADWPDDIINIGFKSVSGDSYLLSFETYHGLGGVFKKLP